MNAGARLLTLRVAILSALAEILLIVVITLRSAQPDASLYAGLLWALLKVAPLLLIVPALLRGSAKAATWLCFAYCGYFVAAVLTAGSPPPLRWLGLLEVLLIVSGFTAGLLFTRWSRAAPAHLAPPS